MFYSPAFSLPPPSLAHLPLSHPPHPPQVDSSFATAIKVNKNHMEKYAYKLYILKTKII